MCLNEETLSIHVNNKHADRQSLFQCAFCGLRVNDFRLYNQHLKEHSDKVHKCYMCSEQFDRGQVKTGVGSKYCDKVCLNEETLSIHVNNKHADRQ